MGIIKGGSYKRRKKIILPNALDEDSPVSETEAPAISPEAPSDSEHHDPDTVMVPHLNASPPKAPSPPPPQHAFPTEKRDSLTVSDNRHDDGQEEIFDEADAPDNATPRLTEEQQAELDKQIQSLKDQAVREVHQEKEKIFSQAQEEGYREGKNQANQELAQQSQALLEALNTLPAEKERLLGHHKPDILKLALDVSETILHQEVSASHDTCMAMVEDALSKVTDKSSVILKVSTHDFSFIQENQEAIRKFLPDLKQFSIEEDPSLSAGGCLIETSLGYVDSTIQTKLATITKAFDADYANELEAHQSEQSPLDIAPPTENEPSNQSPDTPTIDTPHEEALPKEEGGYDKDSYDEDDYDEDDYDEEDELLDEEFGDDFDEDLLTSFEDE